MSPLIRRAILIWFLFIPVAILNGVIRETVYKDKVGDLVAHQISTVIGIGGFLLVAWLGLRGVVTGVRDRTLALIGGAWMLGTIAFEFGFGHFIDGQSWSKLLADYNIFKGHLWSLVLLMLAAAPTLVKRLVSRRAVAGRLIRRHA
jgi:hypothetical protein